MVSSFFSARISFLETVGGPARFWPQSSGALATEAGRKRQRIYARQKLARSTNGPVANIASPARATPWTAPAERRGDGALDGSRTVVETLASCVPRPRNPKRRGASLPAALQDAGALATVARTSARFWISQAGSGSQCMRENERGLPANHGTSTKRLLIPS